MPLTTEPSAPTASAVASTTLSSGGATGGSFVDEDEWELPPPSMRANEDIRTQEELTRDLYKVEEEIRTLRQVLEAKERKAGVIRKKLGITPFQLMGKDVVNGIKTIKESSGAAVQKVTGSDTVQKLNQSYAMQASKSAVSNAASYTKTGFSTLGSGMKSSFGSFKSSLAGLGVPGTSGGGAANGNNSTVLERDDAAAEALFAGSKDENSTNKSGVANSHGDQI